MLPTKGRFLVSLLACLSLLAPPNGYNNAFAATQRDKKTEQERERFEHAAQSGDAKAAYALWRMYLESEDAGKQGLQWLLVAAHEGLNEAREELADYYTHHLEIPFAAEHALYWKQLASAEKGAGALSSPDQ